MSRSVWVLTVNSQVRSVHATKESAVQEAGRLVERSGRTDITRDLNDPDVVGWASEAMGDEEVSITASRFPVLGERPGLPATPPPTDPAERRRELLDLHEQGVPVVALAERYGVSRTRIYNLLKLGQPKAVRRVDWDAVAADRRAGMTYEAIAAKHQTTREYIIRLCKRMGVTKPVAR